MSAKIKICGITNPEDANWAATLGANYIGLNFYSESPRKVSPAQAKKIVDGLPSFVTPVGVFVDHPVAEIVKLVQKVGLWGVQFHGETPPEDIQAVKDQLEGDLFMCKAFRLAGPEDLEALSSYKDVCDYFLLDAKVEGKAGGTGQTFPWELAVEAKKQGVPIFLAGGLNPDNVKEAVKAADPFAVDTASGVEKSPKRKDFNKLKSFMEQARGF